MPSNFELLQAWRDGDRTAGSELFARHASAVFGFFRNNAEHLAEDLTQQTFLACVEARDDFRGSTNFGVYLFTIARNVLNSHLRRKATRTTVTDFEFETVADPEPSPGGVLLFREQHETLTRALGMLPAEQRFILELYYVQRLRAPTIAARMDLPLGTVRSRIRRAIEQLRVDMARLGEPLHRGAPADRRCDGVCDLVRCASVCLAAVMRSARPDRPYRPSFAPA